MSDKMKILVMGRKSVTASVIDYLLSLNVEIVGVLTDSHLSVSVTSDVARKNNIPLYDFDSALNAMKSGELKFDLGISMLYWRKLRDEFISTPKYGIINFHPAPLPDYKGTAGYNIAILHALHSWGVSAHYIDENIDTGNIIKVLRFDIDKDNETIAELEKKSINHLFDCFISIFDDFYKKPRILDSFKNEGGVYVSRIEMEEMKKINFGDDVKRKIRAFWFPPYDGAYIELGGEKYTLIDRNILSKLADPSVSSLFTKLQNK